MQTIIDYCQDILNGLGFIIKLGWTLWANLFSALPYGDPWIAAAAMGCLFVVVDRVVRPRHQNYG